MKCLRLYWFRNLLIMLWSKLLIFFKHKYNSKIIPEGPYCYTPDIEKNNKKEDWTIYYVIPCKYYKTLSKNWNGCRYLGIITDDDVFADQCKMCNENYGDE